MKKLTLALMALLALTFTVKAQQFVSTEPANRNVILEEFTGRNCGYCTDGHRVANQIMAANPGRVWAINIHYGSLSPTSYPNLNLPSINPTISNAFPHNGIPTGVVNRSTSGAIDRGQWNGQANTQLNQVAECNVAGVVQINPDTRVATITVEVYYTGNSSVTENYLTIAMLQDSILGSQSDYGNYNPTQWLNGQYVHMHVLRDVITPVWGEAVSPTTQGTLVTKTYEYQIPEVIGSPNGVDVIMDHIFFLAWVTERYQGTPTRPILNACELEKTNMTNEPIYPIAMNVAQAVEASCSQTKSFSFELSNIGTEELTSMRFNATAGDVTSEFEWNGNLPSGDKTIMDFEMELPFGSFDGSLQIVEANGVPYQYQTAFHANCDEWIEVEVSEPLTTLKVYVIQDQWGEQITWDIINSTGETIAQGGPYPHLMGSGSTQPNVATVNDVPANDCYLFRIYDSNNNGICCNYGNGYYLVKDGNNNILFGDENDGAFGAMASHLFSLSWYEGVSELENSLKVYPNPASQVLNVVGTMTSVEVYNTIGQCLLTKQVDGNAQIDLSGFDNGIYLLRVYNNGESAVRKFTVNR